MIIFKIVKWFEMYLFEQHIETTMTISSLARMWATANKSNNRKDILHLALKGKVTIAKKDKQYAESKFGPHLNYSGLGWV